MIEKALIRILTWINSGLIKLAQSLRKKKKISGDFERAIRVVSGKDE